jgi:hypothetical protein
MANQNPLIGFCEKRLSPGLSPSKLNLKETSRLGELAYYKDDRQAD